MDNCAVTGTATGGEIAICDLNKWQWLRQSIRNSVDTESNSLWWCSLSLPSNRMWWVRGVTARNNVENAVTWNVTATHFYLFVSFACSACVASMLVGGAGVSFVVEALNKRLRNIRAAKFRIKILMKNWGKPKECEEEKWQRMREAIIPHRLTRHFEARCWKSEHEWTGLRCSTSNWRKKERI